MTKAKIKKVKLSKLVLMMKKTNKLFLTMCVAGSFALLFGSCKKNEDTQKVTVNLPTFEEEVDGRAYVDYANGRKFMWNANDQVVIYNLDQQGVASEKAIYATDADAQGRALATFAYQSGDQLTAKKYGYFVFYPVDKVSDGALAEGNYETFTVPGTQNYTVDPAGYPTVDAAGMALACDLSALNSTFTLKHIFGALKIKMIGADAVTKIEVEDHRYNLQGTATMKLHEVSMDEFNTLQTIFVGNNDPESLVSWQGAWGDYKELLDYSAFGTGKVMTLNCEEPVELNTEEETLFIIGLRPGALKYGYTIKVYTVEGGEQPYVIESEDDWHYGIKAGVVKNLPVALPF